jgi:hypothetical protein
MDRTTRELVHTRANRRCEYCGIHEDEDLVLPFHVEHIRAIKHGGDDSTSNLALACNHCNLHKGPNIAGVDPLTGDLAPLFNPRIDAWSDHFIIQAGVIVGRTNVARATIAVLSMNRTDRVLLRRSLAR